MTTNPPPPQRALRSGLFMRTLALAKLSLEAGTRLASRKLASLGQEETEAAEKMRETLLEQANEIAREFGQLKGSVMKVGQLLSVYGENFFPRDINDVMKRLQFEACPLDWDRMLEILVAELGEEKLAELEIEPVPIASASLGQVHRARLRATGESLALKIQYPGVSEAVESDLRMLKMMLSLARWTPGLPKLDSFFEEAREMLFRELDFAREASQLEAFARLLADDPRVRVPRLHRRYSTPKVLATDYIEGELIDSEHVASLSQERRNRLGETLLDVYFRELFVWGRVQTDPHRGNYRVLVAKDGTSDQIVLFDFGAVRELTPEFRLEYSRLVKAAADRDRATLLDAGAHLGFLHADARTPHLDDVFSEFCFLLMEPFAHEHASDFDWKETDLPRRLGERVRELFGAFSGHSPPREVIFLDRKTSGVFVLLALLGARLNGRTILDRRTAQASPDRD